MSQDAEAYFDVGNTPASGSWLSAHLYFTTGTVDWNDVDYYKLATHEFGPYKIDISNARDHFPSYPSTYWYSAGTITVTVVNAAGAPLASASAFVQDGSLTFNYAGGSGPLYALIGGGGDYAIKLTYFGTGEESWVGSPDHDYKDGAAGNDTLLGFSGDDALLGGVGDDVLQAGGGNDSLDGGNGDDLLAGGGGRDSLYGGRGNDVLNGGVGKDRLDGGDGSDVFVFAALPDAARADTLFGFNVGVDRIQLAHDAFPQVGPAGPLNAAAFYNGTTAHDASDRILYDQATGRIYYDADGKGGAGSVLVATLAGVHPPTSVSASDFEIV